MLFIHFQCYQLNKITFFEINFIHQQQIMFKNNVFTFKNLPVEDKQRKWTDCLCTILTSIFALTLFVLTFFLFTRNNYYEVNFPVNSDGKTCNLDLPNAPYLYFQDINNFNLNRYCVASCPKPGQHPACSTNTACSGAAASSYDSLEQVTRLGAFCIPTDSTLADKFWANPEINQKNELINGYDGILIALIIGACVGILFLVFTTCAPKGITYAVFLLASLALLIAAILLFAEPVLVFSTNINGWNIVVGIFLILLAIVFLTYFFCFQKEIQLASIFMNYANIFLKESFGVFGFIPLFLIFSFGLVVLCVWQYVAFGTTNTPKLTSGSLYYTSQQNIFLQVLNAIEFIWGLQFLRDAFNYIVSGSAVQWYFKANMSNSSTKCCRSFSRLLCKNWGSVAGGSLLNAFFNILDIVLDLFRCDRNGSCGKCFNCYQSVCFCLDYLLELVRTDTYAYINLTGIPYCNAARQCQALCSNSKLFTSSQSCIRLYRIASHFFLVTVIVLIDYAIIKARVSNVNTIIWILIILTSYMSVNYSVDLHADAAEGLMICYLAEENCEGSQMHTCPQGLMSDIYNFSIKHQLIEETLE